MKAGQQGSSMIEVLVAMLVLAVGVLGYAGLQVRAMQATGDSYARSQAMAIAHDLAERARLNRAVFSTYAVSTSWPLTGAPTTPPTTCQANSCTSASMATYDIAEVRYNAATLLPAGLVNMERCQGGVGMTLTCIYVSWDGGQPTAGAGGDCVDATGVYVSNPRCIMLEML